ncbi:MAG: hypothetical protein ACD_8C00118G0008, partial [uncultured bacterium]
ILGFPVAEVLKPMGFNERSDMRFSCWGHIAKI